MTLKFKGWLVEHKIKQEEIAKLLNINLSTVNQKINGNADFTLQEIRTICITYQISADEFFICS
jgi:transcriptional regulator with XRE-family HTH domain